MSKMRWGLKEQTSPSLCLQGGSHCTVWIMSLNHKTLCLLLQLMFCRFGVNDFFMASVIFYHGAVIFLQFLHWERGLVLHSEPHSDWTHQRICIQQLLRRGVHTLLLCIDWSSCYLINVFFHHHRSPQFDKAGFFCSRPEIVCGCV